MLINREPTVIIGGIAEIVRAIIPLLLIFGLINWTDSQIGTVMVLIGVLVAFAEKLFIRSQVVSTGTANSQIATAVRMPAGTTVDEVIAKEKKDNQ